MKGLLELHFGPTVNTMRTCKIKTQQQYRYYLSISYCYVTFCLGAAGTGLERIFGVGESFILKVFGLTG